MKKFCRVIFIIFSLVLILECAPATQAAAKNITVKGFIELMVKAAKVKVNLEEKDPYVAAAIAANLIKEGEFNLSAAITKTDAAVLVNRTDILLHGDSYDKMLWEQIAKKKRISDISKIPSQKRDAVLKVFSKGIMIGSGNGKCTQNRKFNGSEVLPEADAKVIAARVKTPSKRRKLSPDGQLIRTSNLPKNYKDYEYILESFPNSFYEAKFNYQRTTYYYTPVELEDYASPAKVKKAMFDSEEHITMKDVMDKNLDNWCDKVEKNLKYRFNVDYRTIDNKWVSELRSTYYVWNVGDGDDAFENSKKTKYIKEYVATAKKNKVIVKSAQITVEPSALYLSGVEYVRAYVKFKVESALSLSEQNKVLYGDVVYIPNLQKGKWLEAYFDINLGTPAWGRMGTDYSIMDNELVDAKWEKK